MNFRTIKNSYSALRPGKLEKPNDLAKDQPIWTKDYPKVAGKIQKYEDLFAHRKAQSTKSIGQR